MCKFCGSAVRSSSDLLYDLVVWDFNSAGMVLQVGISSESALAEALPPRLLCLVAGCSACLIHVHPQVYRAWCVIMLGSMIPCTCCTCLKHPRHSQLSSPSPRGDPISPSLKSPPPLAFERPPIGPLPVLGVSYSPGWKIPCGPRSDFSGRRNERSGQASVCGREPPHATTTCVAHHSVRASLETGSIGSEGTRRTKAGWKEARDSSPAATWRVTVAGLSSDTGPPWPPSCT